MIIPIIFSLDPLYEKLSLTWVFYKALTYANEKEKNGIVIAQSGYFHELAKQKELFPSYFENEVANKLGYIIPNQEHIDRV